MRDLATTFFVNRRSSFIPRIFVGKAFLAPAQNGTPPNLGDSLCRGKSLRIEERLGQSGGNKTTGLRMVMVLCCHLGFFHKAP